MSYQVEYFQKLFAKWFEVEYLVQIRTISSIY